MATTFDVLTVGLVWCGVQLCDVALAQASPAVSAPHPSPSSGEAVSASPAEAKPRQLAEAHHARGVQLYQQRRFALALNEFERAYTLVKDPRLLFTLGQLHYELQQHAAALLALRAYLDRVQAGVPAERRVQVERQLEALQEQTGHIDVVVDVAGADVSIDGRRVGVSPLASPVLVDVGAHQISAAYAERSASTRTRALPRQVSDVSLVLGRAVEPTFSRLETSAWLITAGFAALALAGAVATVVSHRELQSARRKADDRDPAIVGNELEGRERRVHAWAIATDALAGVALVSGGFATYISLTREDATDSAGWPEAARVNVRWAF